MRAGYVYGASASVTLGAHPVWGGAPFLGLREEVSLLGKGGR